MIVVVLQIAVWAAFLVGTLVLGTWLRRQSGKAAAAQASRALDLLFWLEFGILSVVGLFYPGWRGYDPLLGLPSLHLGAPGAIAGLLLLVGGAYGIWAAQNALRRLGQTSKVLQPPRLVVQTEIYEYTRNPMSLGFYLLCLGVGLTVGSTTITLATLLGVIPVHLFFLKYFEEIELQIRLGKPYERYRDRVPFLLPSMRREIRSDEHWPRMGT